MIIDNIFEVGIDKCDRLYIIPLHQQFTMIWRSASEVHWDADTKSLYSPKPREWSYYKWYCHIGTIEEHGCQLRLTNETKWVNVPDELRYQIVDREVVA
jgi:hypothetical protein